MNQAIRSPFHASQSKRGATFMEEGGWVWTQTFGDLEAEYSAPRDDVGVWDVSPLHKWELKGPDALRAAARLHTNRIAALKVGQVRYGAFCDEDGMVIDDGTVYKIADDRVWLMTNGEDHQDHFAGATKGMNVSIEDITRNMPHLGIQGPRSRQMLASLCSIDLAGLAYFHFVPEPVTVGGIRCRISRTGFGGELGYELFCRPEEAADLWEVVTAPGRARPYGVEVLEILRIEAGLIILDYDYEPHQRTPFDLGLDRTVAFEGADFIGRDRLREVAAAPPHRFKTLKLEADDVPEYGSEVWLSGRQVGTLTCPTRSPRFGVIGLAVLDSDTAAEGTRLEVGDDRVPATVAPLAIYDPEKKRPRA